LFQLGLSPAGDRHADQQIRQQARDLLSVLD
jgi:hypothetical protein